MTDTPRARLMSALQRHLDRLDRRAERLNRREDQLSLVRLGTFLAGGVLTFFAVPAGLALPAAVLWIGAFAAAVVTHRRVCDAAVQTRELDAIKQAHLARMLLAWDGLPPARHTAAEPEHPYASDLDIIGPHGLLRLIDTTTSAAGSARLRDWLLAGTPNAAMIARRQALVAELRPLGTFRDRLTMSARRPAGGEGTLQAWLDDPHSAPPVPLAALAGLALLAAINVVQGIAYLSGADAGLLLFTLPLYVVLSAVFIRAAAEVGEDALMVSYEVGRLAAAFRVLERRRTPGRPHLDALLAPFRDPAARPSALLRRISMIAGAASVRANFIAWTALNLLTPWDLITASLLTRSKHALAAALPRWLDAWHEIEALSALATFADLHPAYSFPTLIDTPELHADAFGHPLIPAERKVRNPFHADADSAVTLLTGSNMSGKSSLLRAVGLNIVLAYTGSVADADAMRLGHFRLFTCIRVSDSVVEGLSYFYAEVRRLRALLDALDAPDGLTLFYLIDEIFRGTNNRERLIGGRSYIRALAERKALGIVATHDLELTALADSAPHVRNLHFRETITDGRMAFDYVLRPGPSPTTNALTIMRLEGLPVDTAESGSEATPETLG